MDGGWFWAFTEEPKSAVLKEDREQLLAFIKRNGGHVTVRQIQNSGPKNFRGSVQYVQEELDLLVQEGIGQMRGMSFEMREPESDLAAFIRSKGHSVTR